MINLAGIQMKETDSLTGTSKIYDNARAGLVYEHIKEAGVRGVFVIEDFELYESGIRNTLLPIIEKTSFVDKFVEVEIGLANMFVIVTCSDIKDIPMSLRANMTTIYFQDAEESEIIETINKIIVPKYCREYGIDFPKKIPAKSCRILIYKLANMDMNKLDNVIRTIVVKTVTKGETAFPDFQYRKSIIIIIQKKIIRNFMILMYGTSLVQSTSSLSVMMSMRSVYRKRQSSCLRSLTGEMMRARRSMLETWYIIWQISLKEI